MANSYKNLIITPNRSSSSDDPKIVFSGANTTANTDITLRMYPTSNGTLSFEGSAGQLFSITNDLTGTIYSVSDVSGIPSLAVYANGQVDIARYSGNTFIGSGNTSVVSLNGTANVFFGARMGNLNVGVGTYLNIITPIGDTNMNLSTPSGAVYFDTSIRGPLYYDSNDTGYYLDPRSASVLSGLKLNGVDNDAAGADYILWINKSNNNDWAFAITGQLEYNIKYDGAASHSYGIQGLAVGTEYWRVGTDLLYHNSNIRSPIFYDYNNTNYYLDPNATASLRTVGDWRSDSSTWSGEFSGKIQYHSNHWYIQAADLLIYRNSGGTNVFTVNQSGSAVASADMRAPIFYDTNDTGYYVDPNSTSSLTSVLFGGGPTLAKSGTTGSRNLQLQGASGGDIGLVGLNSSGSFCFQLYASTSDYGFLASAWGSWDLRKANGGGLYLNNQSTYYIGTDTTYMSRVYGITDIRSPLFYDNDDTGYYLNANGTSSLNRIAVVRSSNNVYTDSDYGYGLVGAYSSTRYQGVYAMGDSYKLPADGSTTGSLYGMAWSHPNAGGAAGNLNSHGLLLLQNGSFMAALSTNGTFSADVRGTIFYDYSNSGYYVDPNASTSINVAGAILAGGNITAYYSDERLKTKLGPIENAIDKVKTLDGFYYQANEVAQKLGYKVKRELGLSAQQVQAILPEIVAPAPIDNRYLTIHYERVVPLLVEAIKELNHKHETEIAELKQALAALLNKQ